MAQRRLSVAKALREAWTTDNAVPLVVLDEFVWLSMNDASSVD